MKTIGIILGSGINLKSYDKYVYDLKHIKSKGIHKKSIKELIIENKKLIVFQGRTHLYESNNFEEIFYNVNYAKNNNVELLIITNAAGALNPNFKESDLMLMTSHINFMGKLIRDWGYFPYYNSELVNKIYNSAVNQSLKIRKGVYCALTGPCYETKAEIKFLQKIGIDSVGMSTIPEIYLCSRFGIKTLGISIITNVIKELSTELINHDNVVKSALRSSSKLEKLLEIILRVYDS